MARPVVDESAKAHVLLEYSSDLKYFRQKAAHTSGPAPVGGKHGTDLTRMTQLQIQHHVLAIHHSDTERRGKYHVSVLSVFRAILRSLEPAVHIAYCAPAV